MIGLTIDASDIDRVSADLGATAAEAEAALRTTIARSSRWLSTRVRRGLASEIRLPQKALRRRMVQGRIRKTRAGFSVQIWIGLNPVGLMDYGARQNRRGVRTRLGQHDHAFIARGKSGRAQVFRRTGDARLPIERQTHDIAEDGLQLLEPIVSGVDFAGQLIRTYERELLWRISKRR